MREVSKQQPEWAYEFLETHIQQVSGLTLREGAKYLSPEYREKLMQRSGRHRSKQSKA
ncbi:MAG: DNA alkylation repair protein [Elainellaceae cyanobacterium]